MRVVGPNNGGFVAYIQLLLTLNNVYPDYCSSIFIPVTQKRMFKTLIIYFSYLYIKKSVYI